MLGDISDGNLGKQDSTEEISKVPVLTDAMAWNPVFRTTLLRKNPGVIAGTSQSKPDRYISQNQLAALGGITPEEASVDFEARIKLERLSDHRIEFYSAVITTRRSMMFARLWDWM